MSQVEESQVRQAVIGEALLGLRHRLFRFKVNFDEAGVRSGCNVRRGFVIQAQLFPLF
ncbi:hypothetical protein QFZ25_000179 [Bacillus atrophaeus]|nr:hypothetical protein [Bacillus atrophaeus]MDQ0926119.1 hypothetical protein [Bacillus atrophaeus]